MIDILMAVYNGENYLAEQIESILSQSYTEWRLIICDDGSSDNSFDIISRYSKKYPEKIFCYKNTVPTGSAQGNFMSMTKYVLSDYVMFSDQDDVWLPEKIELTMKKMTEAEKENKNTPILVHSELMIVDSELETLYSSFTKYQGVNPNLSSINRLLVQNNVTGCTAMINRPLFELVKNVTAENMLMHDWWLALTAAAFGRIEFIEKPLIKYRQHNNNQLGAVNNKSIKGAVKIVLERTHTKKRVSMTYSQAKMFYKKYADLLPSDKVEIINKYISIPEKCKLIRIISLIKHNFLKQNFMAAVGQLIFC